MRNDDTDKPFQIPPYAQWIAASAGGFITGMATAVKATRTEFNKKNA